MKQPGLSRRHFLQAVAGGGLFAASSMASAFPVKAAETKKASAFLSSAQDKKTGQNQAVLYHLGEGPLFRLDLPDRGHGPAVSYSRKIAVLPARRPGNWAFALSLPDGKILDKITAPQGRHFYGHAVFSKDDRFLFTTENDYNRQGGVIGIWDSHSWQRAGEFDSGGIGPHELVLSPDGKTLIVANGGILTRPSHRRQKLNLNQMRPNVSYIDVESGGILCRAEPEKRWFQCSLRHLDVTTGQDGRPLTIIAAQFEGDQSITAPLLCLHQMGEPLTFMTLDQDLWAALEHYSGAVRFFNNGADFVVTSPRAQKALFGNIDMTDSNDRISLITMNDVCGIGSQKDGLVLTTGNGEIYSARLDDYFDPHRLKQDFTSLKWDHHLQWV